MGFYTRYDDGNMIIPISTFPALQEALPRLLEMYHVEDANLAIASEQTYYEKMLTDKDSTWVRLAQLWLSLPDEIRPLLSVMRAIARKEGYFVDYRTEIIDQESVKGFTISFDEQKGWDSGFLEDVAPFLLPDTYMQVDDDDGRVRRYVVRDGEITCNLSHMVDTFRRTDMFGQPFIDEVVSLALQIARRQRGEDHLQSLDTICEKFNQEVWELFQAENKWDEIPDIVYYSILAHVQGGKHMLVQLKHLLKENSVSLEQAKAATLAKYRMRAAGAPKNIERERAAIMAAILE